MDGLRLPFQIDADSGHAAAPKEANSPCSSALLATALAWTESTMYRKSHTENAGKNMKTSLAELTESILRQLPPSARFDDADADLVLRYRDLLLVLEDDLVRGFYDTIYAHEPMRVVMGEDDRTMREVTLRQWWQRTVTGPFDDYYWTWQVLVGLVHVKRGVKNPMMIGMWGFIGIWLTQQLATALEEDEAKRVFESFQRLSFTVQALTCKSYLQHYLKILQRTTGFTPALLDRLVQTEIDKVLAETRAAWKEGA